jgi:hypothetical protein
MVTICGSEYGDDTRVLYWQVVLPKDLDIMLELEDY